MQLLTRRSMLSALPVASAAQFLQRGTSNNGLTGIVDAGTYPNLQAAADEAFGPVSNPHGTNGVLNNKVLWIPPGVYGPPSPGAPVLDLKYLHGGRIIGAGRFVTKLIQNIAGIPVLRTNGCGYSHFEGMLLQSEANGTCLNLNWDGSAGGAALQSNTFHDMFFYGGNFGVAIGSSGFMGSENLFLNCFWLLHKVAALATNNFNALQQTIIGGNVQSCGIGFWSGAGSVPVIHGVGFQDQSVCDIQTDNLVTNTVSVAGCRSESATFIKNNGGQGFHVSACSHTSPGINGDFFSCFGGLHVISACRSVYGRVVPGYWAQIKIEHSQFNRLDWIAPFQLWTNPPMGGNACIEIENVICGRDTEIRRQRMMTPDNGATIDTYDYLVTKVTPVA